MNQADIATVEAGFAATQAQARRRSHVRQLAHIHYSNDRAFGA